MASCLALGLLSGMALTSCGDDDPDPTPEVPDTPDTPEVPDTPDEPTTVTVILSTINYYYSNDRVACLGDSIHYFALVDQLVKEKQDSVANANGSLVINNVEGSRMIILYDETDDTAAQAVYRGLRHGIISLGEQAHGFVYTGGIHYADASATVTQDGGVVSTGNVSGSGTTKVYLPDLSGTAWTTTAADAAISRVDFSDESLSCTVNGDEGATFRFRHDGYDVTISQDGAEKYLLRLNEDGTEMRLAAVDGAEVTDGPVFTPAAE